MAAAFGWGTLAASSLVIGAVVAIVFRISLRVIGLIMAFGAGVLISAVVVRPRRGGGRKVIRSRVGRRGHLRRLSGLLRRRLADRPARGKQTQGRRRRPGRRLRARDRARSVLDGIPESMVIGLTIFEGGAVGAAYLAAVFISNLPESISSTAGLLTGGWEKSRILWMWIAIALISGAGLARRLRPVPTLLTGRRRVRAGLRGRRDPHDARGHDDARGVRARRQVGRGRDDTRFRGRVRNPHARLSHGASRCRVRFATQR